MLVKNLSKNISGRDIYEKFGKIKLCKLVVDYYGASEGYGYVYYNEAGSVLMSEICMKFQKLQYRQTANGVQIEITIERQPSTNVTFVISIFVQNASWLITNKKSINNYIYHKKLKNT